MKQPYPGSDEALALGCLCPVIDNGHGKGLFTDENGVPQFVVCCECPLHGGQGDE